ncbi:DUF3157 family protein [Flavisericum labens]|uniref:DUF3157 family protein n=1 Tax=Flavisericum labens TaxID=3377112 RepID=UPI00387AFF92
MKIYVLFLFLFVSFFGFTQNNYIVKTEDGRRVLLKADYTWEYIDAETREAKTNEKEISKPDNGCDLGADFEEPKLNNKIQNQLKKGRATIDHIKTKVAKDYECTIAEVVLLSASEQKSKGVYTFCANGKKVTYKRTGHAIIEKGKLF